MNTIQARPRMTKPHGGYCLIPVTRLYAVWWCYRRGELQFRDLRTYLALEEMRARRCTIKQGRTACYALAELITLSAAGSDRSARASVRRLERVGLSTWTTACIEFHEGNFTDTRADFASRLSQITNNRRRVPVPRRTLRWLAKATQPVLVATVLAHLFRCVYLRGRCITAEGCVSATWVAQVFDVDPRNVKRAKAKLRLADWLTQKPSHHWHRQRYGQSVAINLSWGEGTPQPRYRGASSPPLPRRTGTGLPPPDSDRELPKEMKNQKRTCETGVEKRPMPKNAPRLTHVLCADLAVPQRTAELFSQAARCGLVKESAMDRLQFFAAAHRAMRLGRNPGAFFMTIVRRRLWTHVSARDEESARTELAKLPELLYGTAERTGTPTRSTRADTCTVRKKAEDANTIRELVRQSLATAPAAANRNPLTQFSPSHLVLDEFSPSGAKRGQGGDPCTHGAKALTPFRGA